MKKYTKLSPDDMHDYLERWANQYFSDIFMSLKIKKGMDNYEILLEKTFIPLFIDMIEAKINNYIFKEIEIIVQAGSIIGAFIFCSCLIGYLSFYYSNKDLDSQRYKDFVKTFLSNYDEEALYTDLRCKLVHNYSEGGSYIFISKTSNYHLMIDGKTGKTYINLQNFIIDIMYASKLLFSHLRNNSKLNHLIIERHNYAPLLWFNN